MPLVNIAAKTQQCMQVCRTVPRGGSRESEANPPWTKSSTGIVKKSKFFQIRPPLRLRSTFSQMPPPPSFGNPAYEPGYTHHTYYPNPYNNNNMLNCLLATWEWIFVWCLKQLCPRIVEGHSTLPILPYYILVNISVKPVRSAYFLRLI